MSFLNRLNCEINNDPNYTILMALFTGLLFSGISWGIIYVIIFLILWELLYFGYLNANGKSWNLQIRLTIILAGILGYLFGSVLHDDDDHYKDCCDFKDDMNYYGKEFGWFD